MKVVFFLVDLLIRQSVYSICQNGEQILICKEETSQVARGNDNQVYRPVARSVRVPMGNELETPHGHSHSVVAVSWYPVDTGAFISASADGAVLVWSTRNHETRDSMETSTIRQLYEPFNFTG